MARFLYALCHFLAEDSQLKVPWTRWKAAQGIPPSRAWPAIQPRYPYALVLQDTGGNRLGFRQPHSRNVCVIPQADPNFHSAGPAATTQPHIPKITERNAFTSSEVEFAMGGTLNPMAGDWISGSLGLICHLYWNQ